MNDKRQGIGKQIIGYLKKYSFYIKIIISVVILYIIFTKIDTKAAILLITKIPVPLLVLIIIISIVKFVTQSLNWLFCLKIPDEHNYNLLTIFKTHAIGLALRFFAPGGTATFGKIFYLNPDKKKESFYSIVMEKFFLFWIYIFFGTWACVFLFNKWVILLVIVAIIISLLPFVLPILFKRYVRMSILANYYSKLPFIIIVQTFYMVFTFIHYYIIFRYFVPETNFTIIEIALTMSLVMVTHAIPITFSGLGLKETAAALFLPQIGVPVEIAVGTTLLMFLFDAVLPAIPGATMIVTKSKE